MYVLKDKHGKGYVAKPGSQSSFAKNLANARKFATKEEAEKNRCVDSEVILNLERELDFCRS